MRTSHAAGKFFFVFLLFFLSFALLAATNIPDGSDAEEDWDCADQLAADPAHCESAAEDDPCCSCEECEGGSCSSPGAESAANDSIHFKIGVGQPVHEDLTACRLVLKAEHPSANVFTPQGLRLLRPTGGEITSVATTNLADDIVREVTLINLSGRLMKFTFARDSSTGMPVDDHAGTSWRLWTLDVNGNATTGEPAFYELGLDGKLSRFRFSATTGQSVSFTTASGRTISGTGISEVRVDGVLRQLLTPSTLVDITVPADGMTQDGTIWKYVISFYGSDAAGEPDAAQVHGLLPGLQPFVTFVFEKNVAADLRDTDIDHLKITRIAAGANRVYLYDYLEATSSWTLSKGDEQAVMVRDVLHSEWNAGYTREVRTREISSGTGELAAKTVEFRRVFSWGNSKVRSSASVDDNPANDEVTHYWYFTSAQEAVASSEGAVAAEHAAHHGKRAAVLNPDGSWERYGHDAIGRLVCKVKPWKDLAWDAVKDLSIADAASLGRAFHYEYLPVDANDTALANDSRPRKVTESIAGTSVAVTYHAYLHAPDGGAMEITERAGAATAVYGAVGNQRAATTYFPPGSGTSSGRVRSFLAPSGRLTSHQYEAGSWTPGATPGSGVFTPGTGGALRVVTTEGTAAAPNGIAHRTQQNRKVMDEHGDHVWQETLVYTGTDYERVAWIEQAFDGRGRAVTTWYSDGTRADAAWDCCGKSSETLADGQSISYVYDAIGRLVIKAKENGAVPMLTSHTYDAAGRQLSETISAGGLSLTSSQEYDLAGRVVRQTARDGLVTSVAYADGGRVVSEIHPGGATVQRTSYLDGQQKSLNGTAVVDTWHDYAVDSSAAPGQTLKVATVYQGSVPAGGTIADILRWQKTYVNAIGQIVRLEKTAWGHASANPVVAVSTRAYDLQGRLVKSSVPLEADTLYEYDVDLGELSRTGSDLDGNGILDLETDPVSETATFFQKAADGSWWRNTTSQLYAVDVDDPATLDLDERTVPVTTRVLQERLTGLGVVSPGLGVLVSESRETDIHGNETVSRRFVERDTVTATAVTDVPESAHDEVGVTINGFPVRQISSSNLTTHYLYDALERRIGVTDPRVSVQDTQTGLWTNVNLIHYDALGRVGYTEDTAGNRTTYTYDAAGRVVVITNALGLAKRVAHTAWGQEWRVWGDTEYPVEYGYDDFGNRVSMTTFRTDAVWNGVAWPDPAPVGDTTTWVYDAASGLVTAKTYADGNGPRYAYTADGKLASRTWARTDAQDQPLVTAYQYDNLGRLAVIDYSDATPDIAHTYNRAGLLQTVSDAVGIRTFAYNDQLQEISETITGIYNKTLTRDYTTSGRKGQKQSLWVDHVPNYTYAYDVYGRLNKIITSAGDFDYTRLANSDLVSQMTRPNGVTTTWTYEQNRDLVTQVRNGSISTYGYVNDAIGRQTSMSRSGSAYPTPDTITYSYNDRSEVTGAVSDNVPSYTYAYSYDPIGNRISASEAGVPWTYTANNLNQYTSTTEDNVQLNFAYDLDGSMTYRPIDASTGWTQVWNGENRMVETYKGDDRLTFKYDYMGRRVEKNVWSGSHLIMCLKYVYDIYNRIEELEENNSQFALRLQVWQPVELKENIMLMETVFQNNQCHFLLYDINMNVMQISNFAGQRNEMQTYSPFGKRKYITTTACGFSSGYFDAETGMDYLLKLEALVMYSSELGRHISFEQLHLNYEPLIITYNLYKMNEIILGETICDVLAKPGSGCTIVNKEPQDACTFKCTQQHEEKHCRDMIKCCDAFRKEVEKNRFRGLRLLKEWNLYIKNAESWLECRAYKLDRECLKKIESDDPKCCQRKKKQMATADELIKEFCGDNESNPPKPKCPY